MEKKTMCPLLSIMGSDYKNCKGDCEWLVPVTAYDEELEEEKTTYHCAVSVLASSKLNAEADR